MRYKVLMNDAEDRGLYSETLSVTDESQLKNMIPKLFKGELVSYKPIEEGKDITSDKLKPIVKEIPKVEKSKPSSGSSSSIENVPLRSKPQEEYKSAESKYNDAVQEAKVEIMAEALKQSLGEYD
ncbi:hypothetical protein [Bacillus toyonensis]|uniref:hypothetical protein n=1 Tax=Bacillus toyonensis TaxID=155322 RepID=UPI000BF3D376|nr:hypothetical protein [Bacillus toyonensis]PGF05085.1 hypothetical protein COM61_01240 [Bacillus toyonensis]